MLTLLQWMRAARQHQVTRGTGHKDSLAAVAGQLGGVSRVMHRQAEQLLAQMAAEGTPKHGLLAAAVTRLESKQPKPRPKRGGEDDPFSARRPSWPPQGTTMNYKTTPKHSHD